MNIWSVRADVSNFASSYLVDNSGLPLDFCPDWPDFEGQSIGETYKAFKAKIKDNQPIANFTELDPGILVCDDLTLSKIQDLRSEVEILPISFTNRDDMNIVNVINLVDCLDEGKSDIKYFTNSRNIMDIKSYYFISDLVKNVDLFKIPQFSRTEIFATDSFRKKILRYGLTGLEFKCIFSDRGRDLPSL